MAILQIPVVKSKSTIEIDTSLLSEEVYTEVVRLGLKELTNRGMSKVTKAAYGDADAKKAGFDSGEAHMRDAAQKIATTNVEKIIKGDIRFSADGAVKKASGVVMTEARRLAKAIVKYIIMSNKGRIADYEAKEITAAANALLNSEAGKEILAKAEANIKEREAVKVEGVDIMSLIKTSPALVAKAEARKSKATLSKTQAGKVAPRAKPTAGATA